MISRFKRFYKRQILTNYLWLRSWNKKSVILKEELIALSNNYFDYCKDASNNIEICRIEK
jgi:hypothetical protein